jgi:hypothetical protein
MNITFEGMLVGSISFAVVYLFYCAISEKLKKRDKVSYKCFLCEKEGKSYELSGPPESAEAIMTLASNHARSHDA